MNETLFESPQWPCTDCPFRSTCGAELTDQRCKSAAPTLSGGINELSLSDPDLKSVLQDIDGFDFDRVELAQLDLVRPPTYLPQVLLDGRQGDVGDLDYVAIRLPDLIRDGRVLHIDELRTRANLSMQCDVLVLWFAEDLWLERYDAVGGELLLQIADAELTAITTPSFPTYLNRSRLDFMKNTKRTLNYAVGAASIGVNVLPHIGLNVPHDVVRTANLLNRASTVRSVALDLGCEMKAGNDHTLPLLHDLDMLTDQELHYVIAGVGDSLPNIRKVARRLPLNRVTLTDSSPVTGRPRPGSTRQEFFREQIQRRHDLIHLARLLSPGAPELIAHTAPATTPGINLKAPS